MAFLSVRAVVETGQPKQRGPRQRGPALGRILDTKFLQIDWSFGTLSTYIERPMFEGKMVYTRLFAVRSSQLMAVGLAILRKKTSSSQM